MGRGGHDMAMSQNGLVWNMYLNISFHTPFHTCGTTCLFAVPYPSFHTYGFNCSRFNQNATEMIRQIFWYNFVCTTIPYLFHTLWNKGSAPYPMEQEGARCSPETRSFDAHPNCWLCTVPHWDQSSFPSPPGRVPRTGPDSNRPNH